MKKIITVVAALLLLASCGGGYNPPSNPSYNPNTPSGGNTNNNGGTTVTPSIPEPDAEFTYKIVHPFIVVFTNTSQNATSYSWDFGDGTKSIDKNPVHEYPGKGVYKVVLTASGNGKTNVYTQNITIVAPTKCFVTAIEYEAVPENNEYYNIRCTDNYLLFETLYWKTNWVLLSSANLPYKYTLSNKWAVDFSLKNFVIRLYKNSSSSGTGTEVDDWVLSTNEIQSDYPTGYQLSSKNMKINIFFEWND